MVNEILDNVQLAERWRLHGSAAAIAKRFQRLRSLPKSNPRHLKAFKIGNQTRYRIADIVEYENLNTRTFVRIRSFKDQQKFSDKGEVLSNGSA